MGLLLAKPKSLRNRSVVRTKAIKYPQRSTRSKKLITKIKTPSRQERSEFTLAEKQKIVRFYGSACCFDCGSTKSVSYHHVKFQSGEGRGVWRNGIILCETHHMLCHDESQEGRNYADSWRNLVEDLFGEFYYMDEFDLYKIGKIKYADRFHYEQFMKLQQMY